MTEITSNTNSQFKTFLSLTESKGLKKEGQFLLSGKSLVQEFLQNPHLAIAAEILMEGMQTLTSKASGAKVYKLSKALFEELDVLGTRSQILVLSLPEIKVWNVDVKTSGLTLATPLGDPGNLGALLRSAEAFGIQNVILLSESAHPFLPKAVKASAGSALRLKLMRGPSLKEFVTSTDSVLAKRVVGLDMKGIPIQKFEWPANPILVVGEEGPGFSGARLRTISIPMKTGESLNGMVAASIALYEFDLYSQKSKS